MYAQQEDDMCAQEDDMCAQGDDMCAPLLMWCTRGCHVCTLINVGSGLSLPAYFFCFFSTHESKTAQTNQEHNGAVSKRQGHKLIEGQNPVFVRNTWRWTIHFQVCASTQMHPPP